MTTQASIIINFHDDPNTCHTPDKTDVCGYLFKGHCVLRVVDKNNLIGTGRFLKLGSVNDVFYKDSNCKFIWEKSKR